MEKMITVTTVSGMLEAQIIRGLLEAGGLNVLLSGEAVGSVIGLGIGPLAEVDVLVPANQVSEAQAILNDYQAGLLEDQG